MWEIPFNKSDNPLTIEDMVTVAYILQYNVINGKYTKLLEETLCNMFNVKCAIACANATSGLEIAVQHFCNCMGRVISVAVPAFTWFSTWKPLQYLDIRVCDIDKETWTIYDPPENVDLIISVDTFGNKTNIKTKTPVLYDAAHGFGLSDLGHRGFVEVVSFAFTKIVQGMQGGVILTNDEWGSELRTLVKTYAKMTEIEAFMCLKSLTTFSKRQRERLKIINFYRRCIEVPYKEQLIPFETNYSVYAILFETNEMRQKIVNAFVSNSIEPKMYYVPVTRGVPNTEEVYSRILALPVYHNVEKEKVVEVINSCLSHS